MNHGEAVPPPLYGLMAAFDAPEAVLEATRKAYAAGYRKLEAYTPFPVEGLNDALGYRQTRLPLIVLCGAMAGGIGGFLMQYWMSAIDYPLNIGGRPYFSWPAFIPPTFEMTILLGAFSAVIGMLALNGLPMPYHPVFNVPQFRTASRDGFFLVIETNDPKYHDADTRQFLESLDPTGVYEVER